jgi:hypothetical protein
MSRMSAAHLAPQGGGFEPQRSNNFEIQLYGVPGQDLLVLSTSAFTPSTGKNNPIDLGYLNEKIKVAGQGTWDDAQLTVRDFVDQQTYASLMAWRKMVQDPATGFIGFASTYKKQGDVILLAPDGSVERKFKLVGVWPIDVKGASLSMDTAAAYTVTVTLSVDKVIPEI